MFRHPLWTTNGRVNRPTEFTLAQRAPTVVNAGNREPVACCPTLADSRRAGTTFLPACTARGVLPTYPSAAVSLRTTPSSAPAHLSFSDLHGPDPQTRVTQGCFRGADSETSFFGYKIKPHKSYGSPVNTPAWCPVAGQRESTVHPLDGV